MSQQEVLNYIRQAYPLASSCKHKAVKAEVEPELDDDRVEYYMVERCKRCRWVLSERYATQEELMAWYVS